MSGERDYTGLKQRLIVLGETDLKALEDCFSLCVDTEDHELSKLVRKQANGFVRTNGGVRALELYYKTHLFDAKESFDSFMLYLEHKRAPNEQFWLPRRKQLLEVCSALQSMEDGELDELFLSKPPRVGKTTLIQMFLLWTMGRNPERSNLYCSFTNKPVDTFYSGLLEVLKDPDTYCYADVFPEATVVTTNANDDIIDLKRRKKYASFTGRPIGGSLNGSCDCNGYLIGDDLCEGIEEALSKDRMMSLWTKVDNNLIPRAKETCKRLWMGTRWSLIDPQGIRRELLENEKLYQKVRWKYINTPALDPVTDESNFDYMYGVGFSTEFYRQRRASFERNNDMASWFAQYQGEPIERSGTVFDPEGMRYFNGVLPEDDPDRVFMAVDPAWGGGDFVAAPVCVQYGNDIYVVDVVYDPGDKMVTQPLIVNAVKKYGVQALFVEAVKTTASYTQELEKRLLDDGIRINIQSTIKHYTGSGKDHRILDKAPEIRERMIFLQDGERSKPYSLFMQNVFSFSFSRKNKNDDAPDSLTIAMSMAFGYSTRVEVFSRPW